MQLAGQDEPDHPARARTAVLITTGNLNLAVRRPLRLQFARAKRSPRGGLRTLPHAFTEHGVAVLSSVLECERVVLVNVVIVRATIRLRELLRSHHDLAQRLDELERKTDVRFRAVFVLGGSTGRPPPA